MCQSIKLKKKSTFKILYGLTLLNLIFLLVDEKIRLEGNKKAQVMKALFKKER
jgi:hypothetical protein